LKAVVIGYGSIGKRYVDILFSIPNVEVIICTKKTIIKNTKRNFIIRHSIKECLKLKPDVVFITNVTSAHVTTAKVFAKKGIPLFIEKPLSNSLKGIEELSSIIKSKKLITMIGCNLRFHKAILTIKELIDKGKIGRILSVKSENGSFLPDWHPWENYRQSYAAQKKLGGGVLFTNIHEIDYLYWFFGMPKEIFSFTGKLSDLKVFEDFSSIIMNYKNKILEIHLDFFQKPSERSCKIIGTNGTIFWNSKLESVNLFDPKKKRWKTVISLKNYDYNLMYTEEIKYFLNSVKKNKQTFNDFDEATKILKIALAGLDSSKQKRTVYF